MWGTPIPVVFCKDCGVVPVPEDQLPVTLPDDVEFKPTGESPLRSHPAFLHTTCPKCGGPAERETDTMDTFIDSSWYWFRYLSPHLETAPLDPKAVGYWCPPDLYTGGAEHTVMHLLYSRFFTKVIRDLGLLDEARAAHPDRNWNEPFPRLFHQGVITSYSYKDEDGRFFGYKDVDLSGDAPVEMGTRLPLIETAEKMSKSKLNVVAPDDYTGRYGADVVRLFLMFIGPWEQGGPWNPRSVDGIQRFLNRVWSVVTDEYPEAAGADPDAVRDLQRTVHQTLRKVTGDIERFSFNTMVAALMSLSNTLQSLRSTAVAGTPAWREALELLTLMLAPIAPHLAEEMWERLGKPYSVHTTAWPEWSEELAAEDAIEIPVQINGKLRSKVSVPPNADEASVREIVHADDKVQEALTGKQLRKFIYVSGRLVNLVIG
jgi:leucyl-tRNA synthetase